jgi:predicted peptidase
MMQTSGVVRVAALFTLFVALTGCSGTGFVKDANVGAPVNTGFVTKTMGDKPDGRKYSVFIPHNYAATKKYPTIVFLHGIGEGGSDGTHCLTVGLGPAIAKRANDFPFIVIFPQSTGGWNEKSQAATDAIATLKEVEHTYAVDQDRVILTGLSTGGYGTWSIGATHKQEFAALVPMCAYSAYDFVPQLTNMPVWCFHNGGDPFVGSGGSKEMCDRINAAGGHAKYTQYSAFGHDCWNRAYNEGELFAWMLQQKRTAPTASAK